VLVLVKKCAKLSQAGRVEWPVEMIWKQSSSTSHKTRKSKSFVMLYADVQKRGLTSNHSQYGFFRKENKQIFKYLRKFPILPRTQKISFTDKWDFAKFLLHKISYFVEPQLKVFAYLLIPKQMNKKVPGILALHEHNDEYKAGKSEVVGLVKDPRYTKLEAVYPDPAHRTPISKRQFAYGKELCEKGFVVLAPDFIGFEEYRDNFGLELNEYYEDPRFIRGYEEMLSEKYLLYGSCLMAKHIHDLYVAVSILSSIEHVDSNKIGVIGHSLGGEMTSIITAFDKRIKAGVNSCGTFSYEDFENSNRMETANTIIPNFRSDNKDFDFFLDMIPPTPFLATNGAKDIGSMAKKLLKNKRKNFEVVIHKEGHEFPSDVRNKAYSFLQKNLT